MNLSGHIALLKLKLSEMETTQKNSPEEIEAAEVAVGNSSVFSFNKFITLSESEFLTIGTNHFLAGINYQKERSYTRRELSDAFDAGREKIKHPDWDYVYDEFNQWFNKNYPETK